VEVQGDWTHLIGLVEMRWRNGEKYRARKTRAARRVARVGVLKNRQKGRWNGRVVGTQARLAICKKENYMEQSLRFVADLWWVWIAASVLYAYLTFQTKKQGDVRRTPEGGKIIETSSVSYVRREAVWLIYAAVGTLVLKLYFIAANVPGSF
jgi:hypothetical protein